MEWRKKKKLHKHTPIHNAMRDNIKKVIILLSERKIAEITKIMHKVHAVSWQQWVNTANILN